MPQKNKSSVRVMIGAARLMGSEEVVPVGERRASIRAGVCITADWLLPHLISHLSHFCHRMKYCLCVSGRGGGPINKIYFFWKME